MPLRDWSRLPKPDQPVQRVKPKIAWNGRTGSGPLYPEFMKPLAPAGRIAVPAALVVHAALVPAEATMPGLVRLAEVPTPSVNTQPFHRRAASGWPALIRAGPSGLVSAQSRRRSSSMAYAGSLHGLDVDAAVGRGAAGGRERGAAHVPHPDLPVRRQYPAERLGHREDRPVGR